MSWYAGAAAGAAAAAAAAAYNAGQMAGEIPVLDPVLTEFLSETGIAFYEFAEALELIGVDISTLIDSDTLTMETLQNHWLRILEVASEGAINATMISIIEGAVEDNKAHMEETWGAVELQWHDWGMAAIERRLEESKAALEQDTSFWGRVWDVITDPFGETADFWGDVFSGIGAWFEDNLFPWLESRAEGVVGVAGRILEKVW